MLFVAVHRQNFQRIQILRHWMDLRETAFLPDLPQRHGQQIPVSVGVAAQPGPGVIELVIGHQDLASVRADHPGGGGKMGGGIGSGIQVLVAVKTAEQLFTVLFLLLIPRTVGDKLLAQKLHSDPSEKSVQRGVIRCRIRCFQSTKMFFYPGKATKLLLDLSYHILWKKKRTTTKKENKPDRYRYIL